MSQENSQGDEEYNGYDDYDYEQDYSQQTEQLLTKDDLYEVFKLKLIEISEIIQQPVSITLNILIYYNFQDCRIKEEYLINPTPELISALTFQGILQTSSVHFQDKINCKICQNVSSGIALDCQHYFCNSCWSQMIEVQFSSFIPIVNCLQDGCLHRLPLKYLEQNSQFKQIVVKRYMYNDKSITWCPGLNCNNVYKCQQQNITIKCNCGIKFCSNCKLEKHHPIPCDINKKLVNLEETNDFWVNLNASKCPNCGMMIQRIQGCFHLKCPCGQHFCFACSKPWVKDHEASFFDCPYLTSKQNISKYAKVIKSQHKIIDNVVNEWKQFMNTKLFSSIQFNLEKIFQKLQHLIKIMRRYKQLLNYNYYLLDQKNDEIFQQHFETFQDSFTRLIFQITETLEQIQVLYTENDPKLQSQTLNQDNSQNQLTEIFDFTEECNQIYNQIKLQKKQLLRYIENSLIN